MRLLFLVNGTPESAAGHRARAFACRLPSDWKIETAYRPAARKWRAVPAFVRAARAFRPDIVYVVDTAYAGVLAGVAVRRLLRGCRLVTDTGDTARDLAASNGAYSARAVALIGWVERLAMTRSDRMVVRGSYHKTLLEEERKTIPPGRAVFIPDGVDLEVFRPMPAVAACLRAGASPVLGPEHFVLGMVGTMAWSRTHQMGYGWDVVEALGLLRENAPHARGLLVGDGDGRAILEARARALGVSERIVFARTRPMDALAGYISAMDVCVSTQSNDVVGNVRTTGKLPLYLACGRYVAATDAGEARRVLPGVGVLLPYTGVKDRDHPGRLAAHVRELMASPALLCRADQARQVAEENFSYTRLTARVRALCEELTVAKP